MNIPSSLRSQVAALISLSLTLALCVAPLTAQQRRTPAPTTRPAPTFDTLLAADSYIVYGEVRNVGQLLTTGGAGEIVDPIFKLAQPPKEFQSIISFLKSNSEALATSRLLFAAEPARPELPATLVAIEFSSPEEANKFAPKLEKFLPEILPPVPDATPEASPVSVDKEPTQPKKLRQAEPTQNAATSDLEPKPKPTEITRRETAARPTPESTPAPAPSPSPVPTHLPFVITHAGNLVCISDKPIKFEKLNPAGSKPLVEDQHFRIAHDRFPSETVFLFFNAALEVQAKPQPSPKQQIKQAEIEQIVRPDTDEDSDEAMAQNSPTPPMSQDNPITTPEPVVPDNEMLVLATPSPTPKPTKEQAAQSAAFSQIWTMLDFLGRGEEQMPEAVGVALNLDNDEYVIRMILVESHDAKRLLIPFVPQLISGPAYTPNAPSVLPDDTEVFISASIDFAKTHEGMRKQAEVKAKENAGPRSRVYENGVLVEQGRDREPEPDPFAEFEKRAGFKIKDDLVPVLGNEIGLAASLKSLQGLEPFGLVRGRSAKPSSESADDRKKAGASFPMLLIAIKDREAARPLMPRVFNGLGLGEANMIAQTERHGDSEMVNYGGVFAYAFVGNFLVISEATTVRHVIDANENHQTLSSNNAFRNFRRWQPRQILGEVYVSPAMMEGYQDEIRKQSATIDEKMRDFLLQLSPTASAISYALSNEGFGEVHELHLPKNLILAMVAGMSSVSKPGPMQNEMIAIDEMHILARIEESYKADFGNGSYGTLEQLNETKLTTKPMLEDFGYKYELIVTGDGFEVTATPIEYGKTGKRSFFIDKSGVLRGDDHGGAPATAFDKPVEGP